MLLAVTGCVPMRFSGYEASGNGKQQRGYCIAWIKDELLIEAPRKVDLIVRARVPEYGNALDVMAEMRIPKGVVARWLDTVVTYASSEWSAPRVGRILGIRGPGSVPTPDSPIRGELTGGMFDRGAAHYVSFSDPDGKSLLGDSDHPIQRFSMTLPALDVDGVRFDPGTVHFKAYQKWGQYSCVQ
ncbi:MAG: hypothetical protein FJ197_10510 [Gammaproteobacteria bacterium]|nr:hypothetical protein [Gammaproteobacteria bacterium]